LLVRPTSRKIGAAFVLFALIAFGGCHKSKQKSPAAAKAEAKRQQAACASPIAYDRLKNSIFDEAIAKGPADRSNLDTLADYSIARMENPVVKGWDPSLDITRCEGRFVLEVPPGAERGLGGARQLQADVEYTAQPSADGAGLVYQQRGADGIVAKLVSFNLGASAFRPPPAIDQDQHDFHGSQQVSVREAPTAQASPGAAQKRPPPDVAEVPKRTQAPKKAAPMGVAEQEPPRSTPRALTELRVSRGEGAVRAFYAALCAGNGSSAASQIVPEKRSTGPFSAGAISRFYGRLAEPLRLTSVTPEGSAYRVTYRYSAGRSRCNGVAVVRVSNRGGRDLISSIRSLSGC
jgi:hypothetical protein